MADTLQSVVADQKAQRAEITAASATIKELRNALIRNNQRMDALQAEISGADSIAGGLAAAIATKAGQTLVMPVGAAVLDASVTATDTLLAPQHGTIITVPTSRTLGSAVDWARGGKIQPANGVVVTLTGLHNLPPNHHAFDVSLGGSFQIKAGSVPELTPENFGAKNDDAAYDDIAWRAWLTALHYDATSNRAIRGRPLPGVGYKLGLIPEVVTVDWGGTPHYEFVAHRVTKSGIRLCGPGAALASYHTAFFPAWAATTAYPTGAVVSKSGNLYRAVVGGTSGSTGPTGTGTGQSDGSVTWDYICANDPWRVDTYLLRYEGPGPIVQVGLSGVLIRGGNDGSRKTGVDFHDVRDVLFEDVHVNNWTDSWNRSVGLRWRGRDANESIKLKTNCDIPMLVWYNDDETAGRDANGLPLALRDTKALDHIRLDGINGGVVDNIYKAVVLIGPGVPVRNLTAREVAAVGGAAIVCVDRLDSAPATVTNVDTTDNELDITGHAYQTGDQIQLMLSAGGAFPGVAAGDALATGVWYYAIKASANAISLARTQADALAGVEIDFTGTGSGTITVSGAAFRGADVAPIRASNHWEISNGRTEGLASATGHAGIRIERHKNGRLRELKLSSYHLGEGADARRKIQTGGGAYTGETWKGLIVLGVEAVDMDGTVRYGGVDVPLTIDARCLLSMARTKAGRLVTRLVPRDNGLWLPEAESHWAFLNTHESAVTTPQHFYLLQNPTQGGNIIDEQSSGTDYPLIAGGTAPTYMQLVDEWHGGWLIFNEAVGERVHLNSTAAEHNPITTSQLWGGIFYITNGWTPGGTQRDIINIGGGNLGPLLRCTNGAGTLFLRANTTDGAASSNNWNNGHPFLALFRINHATTTIECLLIDLVNGTSETITVAFPGTAGNATVDNGSSKCLGGYDGIRRSWSGGARYLIKASGSAAEQSLTGIATVMGAL